MSLAFRAQTAKPPYVYGTPLYIAFDIRFYITFTSKYGTDHHSHIIYLYMILSLFQIMQRSLSPYSVTGWAKSFTSHLIAFGRDFRVTSELRTVRMVCTKCSQSPSQHVDAQSRKRPSSTCLRLRRISLVFGCNNRAVPK